MYFNFALYQLVKQINFIFLDLFYAKLIHYSNHITNEGGWGNGGGLSQILENGAQT